MNWEIWGMIAGTISLSGLVPQIYKGYRSKQLNDLSYGLNLFMMVGATMWFIYGMALNSASITIANALAILLNLILLGMKYYYKMA